MGLVQVGASILASLLIGALTRFAQGARSARAYLLLACSVLAVYWFQPLVPLRSFDFWLPSLTLALVILVWFITAANPRMDATAPAQAASESSTWRSPQNLIALALIVGLPAIIALSRYFLSEPLITSAPPPRFIIFLFFVI